MTIDDVQKRIDETTDDPYLTGKLLIAMPGIGDPRFDKTVIYMCAHSEEGAMGIVVNREFEDLSFPDLLEQLNIMPIPSVDPIQVQFGGPVESGRGFVLHSQDYMHDGSLAVDDNIALTATVDILRAIADDAGPRQKMLALGLPAGGPDSSTRNSGRTGGCMPMQIATSCSTPSWRRSGRSPWARSESTPACCPTQPGTRDPMARGNKPGKSGLPKDPETLMAELIRRMDACPDAESLNDNIIMPFALALEKVALARGYTMNIYGEASNIAVTSDEDAETIYHLIEEYLDARD